MSFRLTHRLSPSQSLARPPRRLSKVLSQGLFLVALGLTIVFASIVRKAIFGVLQDRDGYASHTTNVIVKTFVHNEKRPSLPILQLEDVNNHPPDNGVDLPSPGRSLEILRQHGDDDGTDLPRSEDVLSPEAVNDQLGVQPHTYLPNGLLRVNPLARLSEHPILELIARSERLWRDQLDKQSQTLDEAVIEYGRRYGRLPPRGFDRWYAYHTRTKTLLPDEYDSITHSLSAFWHIPPEILSRNLEREAKAEREWGAYVIGKLDSSSRIELLVPRILESEEVGVQQAKDGSSLIVNLLKDVENDIPGGWKAVVRVDDLPGEVWGWDARQKTAGASISDALVDPGKRSGWLLVCAPDSPAVTSGIDLSQRPVIRTKDPSPSSPSSQNNQDPLNPLSTSPPRHFIHTHAPTFSPCHHPTHFQTHGQFLAHKGGPTPEADYTNFVPAFSYSKTVVHGDVMMSMPWGWVSDEYDAQADPGPFNYTTFVRAPFESKNETGGNGMRAQRIPPPLPWDEKYDSRLQWRGSNTGIFHAPDTWWETSQRIRMMEWATGGLDGWVNVLRSPMSHSSQAGVARSNQESEEGEGLEEQGNVRKQVQNELLGDGLRARKSDWSPAMLDIAFAGEPKQCDEANGVCQRLKGMWEWRKAMGWEEQRKYKYVLDVDGNAWSNRFKRLITSGSLVFKSTIYEEWWQERVQPWVHYIPIQNDLSDLWDALTFFRGGPGGTGAHEDLARKIAEEGRRWSKRFWREEDMTAYMYRLILEYARVMHPERDTSPDVDYNHWETEGGRRYLETDAGQKYLHERREGIQINVDDIDEDDM